MHTGRRTGTARTAVLAWMIFLSVCAVPSWADQGAAADVAAGSAAPEFPPRSKLASLASAGDTRGRCDVVLNWLESGATPNTVASRGAVAPVALFNIFRDEKMRAVFGKVYDQDGGAWRGDVFESTLAPCLGQVALRRPNPLDRAFGGLLGKLMAPQRLPPDYVRQFLRYSSLLREAFGGQRGPFEPALVTRQVQEGRLQMQHASTLVASASNAPADLDAFHQLHARSAEVGALTQLTPDERQALARYLAERQTAMAPTVAQAWLARVQSLAPTPESARQIHQDYVALGDVVARLPADARQALEQTVAQRVDAGIAPSIQAEQGRLQAMAPTQEGARQLTEWESAFIQRFGAFTAAPSFAQALQALDDSRSSVLTALLPAWTAQISQMPGTAAELAARSDELKILFGGGASRLAALYGNFREPLQTRDAQIQARAASEEQARLAQAQRATPPAPGEKRSVSLQAADFHPGASSSADLLGKLYQGDFDAINLRPHSTEMSAIASGYIDAFSNRCRKYIADPVELTTSVCDQERVQTVNEGFGPREVSRTCVASHMVGTGVYAERTLDAAMNANAMAQMSGSLRTLMNQMSRPDGGLQASVSMVNSVMALKTASESLVASNDCAAPGLVRFRTNLENFLLGRPGIRLDGSTQMGVAMLPPAAGETYHDSHYDKLLDDLVSDQSSTWALNRYVRGSIFGTTVNARDSAGRPTSVSAGYAFQGFRGKQGGRVSLSFEQGRPQCLFFSDAPNECRSPLRAIVLSYINGKYR